MKIVGEVEMMLNAGTGYAFIPVATGLSDGGWAVAWVSGLDDEEDVQLTAFDTSGHSTAFED